MSAARPSDVVDHRCDGCHCTGPHRRLPPRPGDPVGLWRVACLEVAREHAFQPFHQRLAPGLAACGEVLAPPRRVAGHPSFVDCPACLLGRWEVVTAACARPPWPERCPACGALDEHPLSLWTDPWRAEVLLRDCLACAARTRAWMPAHHAASPGSTWCGLPVTATRLARPDPPRPSTFTCPDCAWMYASEQLAAPPPDWRPAVALPEDFYAL